MAPLTMLEEIGVHLLEDESISSSKMFMSFVKCGVMVFLAVYHVFKGSGSSLKSMEPLSSDSPAEIDVIRKSSMIAKVFVSAPDGNRERDLPHGKCKL